MDRTARLEQIRDRDWWRSVDSLTVEGDAGFEPLLFEAPALDGHVARLVDDGYFSVVDAVDARRVAALLDGVRFVLRHDLPVVFVFAFDEAWSVPRHLETLLARTVGEGYRLMPDFWGWFIDPIEGQAGWRPHRDRAFDTLDADGLPKCLTLWLALTDATPDNGCIYVLPASRDPTYRQEFTRTEVKELQSIRALPATAGTILGWNQNILHWGARATPHATAPRVSIAFELQRGSIEPFRTPLLDPASPPAFADRLQLIAQQVLQYRHMHMISDELEWLVEQLTAK